MVRLREILTEEKLHLTKRLGQHLFLDKKLAQNIISDLSLSKKDTVIEIGSGLGIFSSIIAERVKKLILIEKDRRLIELSKSILSGFKNIEFRNADILKNPMKEFKGSKGCEPKVFENIPYNITGKILKLMMENQRNFSLILLIMQREVAEKLKAKPNSKNYGSLSVTMNYLFSINLTRRISKNLFYPKPSVTSSAVLLKPVKGLIKDEEAEKLFFKLVRSSFLYRRKTLLNGLDLTKEFKKYINKIGKFLSQKNYKPKIRAQELSLNDFIDLARYIKSKLALEKPNA